MENVRHIKVSRRSNKFYIIACTYRCLRDCNDYMECNEFMDEIKKLEDHCGSDVIISIVKRHVEIRYIDDQENAIDYSSFGGPNNPPSTNKYIIRGSEEEFQKYGSKVYNLHDQLDSQFQEAEQYLIDNHINGYKMSDGTVYDDYEEFMNLMFGDIVDLKVTCSVIDAVNKTLSCPICNKFIKLDINDLVLMSEFIRCFGF